MAAILDAARTLLGTHGAAALSLREVAREVGLVSSAVYRYVASRDELLTILIVEAYDAIGDEAEQAAKRASSRRPTERFVAVARAMRRWAIDHPHEYALVYGTPVPGYDAPQDTVAPAARVTLALVGVIIDAHRDGKIRPRPDATIPVTPALRRDVTALAAALETDLPVDVLVTGIAAWTQIFGLISFELFGQTRNVIHAHEDLFVATTRTMADMVGLD